MNIKLTGLVLGTALSAFAFSACSPAANTNTTNANANRAANNTAVVVPANNNTVVSTTNNAGNGNWTWNANVNRADWEKSKDDYAKRAKDAGDTVGQGANDAWLWTKTRAALMTTADLRESTINVDVNNDVVTLRGTVANAAQKTKAEQVAKGIEGVKSVTNSLKVAAGDSLTNQAVSDDDKKAGSNTKANANK